ncbi:MAG: cytochrome C oxidase subunit IV family protein [Chloroflexi bacterium]|nr:cytochrome C oxidase subunit IV family protein [Chloroflexota bacterium]
MQTVAPLHDEHEGPHHPSTSFYVKVGAALFAVTAIEVALFYVHAVDLTIVLYALSAIKFAAVVAYFMHLWFDNKLFTVFFVASMILAASVITAVMALMGGFGHGSVPPPGSGGAHAPAAAPAQGAPPAPAAGGAATPAAAH